ncbi:hypothetical protein G7085_16520 [Tessaracoccus sp. HDW20]|uniref:hypothetical protein n=1 Tax=Tessaracoccus coleopterorum TaxID=2714950 RepID=UPI0018D3ECD3|nr:hypothetical protein [Tessaracoccus coleopterorum]NHB85658.1 hypothetical protein [Tessaracoccus coleopterorum]
MFGGLFTMLFIFVMISMILGVTRGNRGRLGDSGMPTRPLDMAPRQQITPGACSPEPYAQQFGMQPFGQLPVRQGYDPAAHQPISEGSREAINRDITSFGEELRDLDLEVVGLALDEATQADYTEALDAYDGAKQRLAAARTNADVRQIAEVMEGGRYAAACVRARAKGNPVPERRPPASSTRPTGCPSPTCHGRRPEARP